MTLSKNYSLSKENSAPKLQTWLKEAETKLKDASTTPRLDSQLIAGHFLKQDKHWLLVHDSSIPPTVLKNMNAAIDKRLNNIPVAYIVGQKEFYSREFLVNRNVLIPRPETEALIEMLAKLNPKAGDNLIDIGTGSGAIAITTALEWPLLTVHATDISLSALSVAKQNAKHLNAKVRFRISDLLSDVPSVKYNFIVANLPYVDGSWQTSPETMHEPSLALFADNEGLELIKKLLQESPNHLAPIGHILIEADPRQHTAIIDFAKTYQLELTDQQGFVLAFTQRTAQV